MDKTRQQLINLVQGGDGRVAPWIEKVTLRRPGQEDAAAYVAHIPTRTRDGHDLVVIPWDGNLETCQEVLHLVSGDGAQPRSPQKTADEVAAEFEAWRATLPAPEDCGRVVADLAELDNKD